MRELGPMNPAAPAFPLATAAMAPLRAHWEAQGQRRLFTAVVGPERQRLPRAAGGRDHAFADRGLQRSRMTASRCALSQRLTRTPLLTCVQVVLDVRDRRFQLLRLIDAVLQQGVGVG